MNIYGQVIHSDEIVYGSTYFCQINTKYHWYGYFDMVNMTAKFSLCNVINFNVKVNTFA